MKGYVNSTVLFLTTFFSVACATSPNHDAMSAEPEATHASTETTSNHQSKFTHTDATVMFEILIAEIASNRGHNDIALEHYFRATQLSDDPRIAERSVQIASFSANSANILKAAKLWANTDPNNVEAKRTLAVLYLREKNFDAAKLQLETLLASDPDSVAQTFLHIGALLQREADQEDTTEITEYLADLYPHIAEAQFVAAQLSLRSGKYVLALKRADKTLAIKPDWIESIILRANILKKQNQVEDALKYLSDYLEKKPDENNLRFTYARTLIDAKSLKKAQAQFEILATKMPNNEDIIFTLAMLSMEFKQYDQSEQYLNQIYHKGQRNPRILYYRGQIAERKQQNETALEHYAQLRPGDYYFEAQLRTTTLLADTEGLDKALAHLHAVNVTPVEQRRELILFEGNLLKDFKRFDEAYNLYTNALNELPDDIEILFARSLIAERLNKLDITLKDLNFIISKEPDNAAALNALGYTLADRTERYDEAMVFISKALALEPNDAAIIDSLGWVQFRLGNIDQALTHLRKALDMIHDGEIAAHLGEVLWTAGDKEEAQKIWQQALEKFTDNEILIKTMQRFGQ